MLPFTNYQIATATELPPIQAAMYEYWMGGNGVFIRAKRQGLSVTIHVASCNIRGLAPIQTEFNLEYPLIPAALLGTMLERSQLNGSKEILFHLNFTDGEWHLEQPNQIASTTSCKPISAPLQSSYERAIVEVHSHHLLSDRFSNIDDSEETGFRIFAVLGTIFTNPTIRVRVGAYNHFWEIPASWVFEIPNQIGDSVVRETRERKCNSI